MTRRRLSLVPLLLATLLLPAACAENAKNMPGPAAPSAAGEKEKSADAAATAAPVTPAAKEEAPDTLEAQVAALAAAEGQIDQVLAGAKKLAERERDEAVAKAPGAGPRGGVARPTTAPGKPAADAGSVGSSCALACSALASMNRAVSHLCALAGEGDRRCEDGRTRERSATQRVHASCPSCSS